MGLPVAVQGRDVAVVKLTREEARTRRLQSGEEERLLLAANGLEPLIIAALETGMRLGELLSLQWSQVGARSVPAGGEDEGQEGSAGAHLQGAQAVLDARGRSGG